VAHGNSFVKNGSYLKYSKNCSVRISFGKAKNTSLFKKGKGYDFET